MLLVTGATGTTGMEVLRALKARGAEARALVRDETKAHHLRDLGFEPATGDLGDPRTLGPALEGVERAYLVSPIGPMQSEFEQAFLETAKEAGVKHVVKLLGDRRLAGGAAALRPHPRQGRDGAEGVRHGLDAAAPDRLHAEHAGLGLAGARRDVLLAGPGRGVQHRRRARRGRGRRGRADRRRATRARPTASAAPRRSPTATRPGACSPPPGARSRSRRCRWRTLKRELVRAGVPPWNAEGLAELFELYAGRRRADGHLRRQGHARSATPRDLDDVRHRPRGGVPGMSDGGAWGAGLATFSGDRVLEVFYPAPALGARRARRARAS